MFCTTHKPSHGRLWAYSNVLNEYQFPEKKRKDKTLSRWQYIEKIQKREPTVVF